MYKHKARMAKSKTCHSHRAKGDQVGTSWPDKEEMSWELFLEDYLMGTFGDFFILF